MTTTIYTFWKEILIEIAYGVLWAALPHIWIILAFTAMFIYKGINPICIILGD